MIVRTAAMAMAIVLVALAGAASAQGIQQQAEAKAKAIAAELQTHTVLAKAESSKGAAALQSGDKASACTSFNVSRGEAQRILDLFPQQREQVILATSDAALALARVQKIDENHGVWVTLASQLDERMKLVCGS